MKLLTRICLWLGPLLLLLTLITAPPGDGISVAGWHAVGLTAWMALWWMSECVPIPATALLPIVVAPMLGLGSGGAIASAYGHPLIFLFLGGFLLSIGMERTGLHLRIAWATLRIVGDKPRNQVAGVMTVTAFLSMWMSNTATTIIMLPIALSMVMIRKKAGLGVEHFGPSLLLGIAYGATIGGMATLIGTPPNAFMAAYLASSYGLQIGFAKWMFFALPLCLVMLFLAWAWLSRIVWNEGQSHAADLESNDRPVGRLGFGEWGVLLAFGSAVFLWVFRVPLTRLLNLDLSDTAIAVAAGLSLFILPLQKGEPERILSWNHTRKVPWGVLILFGGGLALAEIIQNTGLDASIGRLFIGMEGVSRGVLVAALILVVVVLTEVTSNTATTATLLPLLTPVAVALGGSPTSFAIPIALAASCAFMMPVATPPNAIVFGSGHVAMRDFIRHGIALNIIASLIVILAAILLVPVYWG